jgi:iron complex transport system ATP-binding protein
MKAIEVSGLAKKYGRFEALRGVGVSVGRGEVFGLVGPNGAGKTTLMIASRRGRAVDLGRLAGTRLPPFLGKRRDPGRHRVGLEVRQCPGQPHSARQLQRRVTPARFPHAKGSRVGIVN